MSDATSENPRHASIRSRVSSCQGLVRAMAWKIWRRLPPHVDMEDLVAYGQLGLVEAASRYQEGRDAQFSTFAYRRVRGAILDSVSRHKWFSAADYHSHAYEDERVRAEQAGEPDEASRVSSSARRAREDPPSPAQAAAIAELKARVRTLVDSLPKESVGIVRLVYFEGLTLSEAAERMSISRAWACRRHQRALDMLAASLGEVVPRSRGHQAPRGRSSA